MLKDKLTFGLSKATKVRIENSKETGNYRLVYSTITSSTKTQARSPAPACPSGIFAKFSNVIFRYLTFKRSMLESIIFAVNPSSSAILKSPLDLYFFPSREVEKAMDCGK